MALNPITGGYIYGERTNQGGIVAAYIGLYNGPLQNTPAMTYTIASTGSNANMITAFGGATVSMFTVTNRQEQASLMTTPAIGANGTVAYAQTYEFVVEIVTPAIANWVQQLIGGQWRVMVLDVLGNYVFLGAVNGGYITSAPGGPGGKIADGNKITLTFKADEATFPIGVTPAAAATLIS